jgi:hypothetical protein
MYLVEFSIQMTAFAQHRGFAVLSSAVTISSGAIRLVHHIYYCNYKPTPLYPIFNYILLICSHI